MDSFILGNLKSKYHNFAKFICNFEKSIFVKLLNKGYYLSFLILFISSYGFSQNKKITYFDSLYVLYSDFGYTTAPFGIKYSFKEEVTKLRFRNDFNANLGLGFSYRWLSVRIGIPLKGLSRADSRFGKTNAFDFGFDFSFKRFFFDFDAHAYRGYAIKNAYKFVDSLNTLKPHSIRSDINSASVAFSSYFFKNKDMKMQAFRGKTAHYKEDCKSIYFKYSLQLHGLGSLENKTIFPSELIDSLNSLTLVKGFGALDFGFIPGYVYVKRINNWQIGAMAGLGLVVQFKSYYFDNTSRLLVGLAPRFDFKFTAGYNTEKYFLFFTTDIENKAIRFQDFRYKQTYYNLRIVGGKRILPKKQRLKDLEDYL